MPSDIQLPDGSILQGVPDGTTQGQLIEKLRGANNPNWRTMVDTVTDDYAPDIFFGHQVMEPLAALVSGTAASIAGGVAGTVAGAYDAVAHGTDGTDVAASVIEKTEKALTYQPRTKEGKQVTQALGYLPGKLNEWADDAGRATAEKSGSPLLGATVNTALQGVPMLFGGFGEAGAEGAAAAASRSAAAAATAAHYVETATSLKWGDLSAASKAMMTSIATDAEDLKGLDPKAVEAKLRADSHKVAVDMTRGQADRDPAQLKREEIARGGGNQKLIDIQSKQDQQLYANLEAMRAPDAKVRGSDQVGRPVQHTLARKLQVLKGQKNRLYNEAAEKGETQLPVDVNPLMDWLKQPQNSDPKYGTSIIGTLIKHYGEKPAAEGGPAIALPDKFGTFPDIGEVTKAAQSGRIKVNDLEEIRKAAVHNTFSPDGGVRHKAGEAISIIDQILDKSGGDTYKASRAANKAINDEFQRQGMIHKLTSTKPGTTDRSVALENTFQTTVIRGSAADLTKVRASLLEGGTEQTRAAGARAWRDLQAGAVDYLKESAGGRRQIKNPERQGQFNGTFLDSLYDLDNGEGKLDILFGRDTANAMRSLAQTVGDVRTSPTLRKTGSDSVSNMLLLAENAVDVIPGVREVKTGAKILNSMPGVGRNARAARNATRPDQLSEAARRADKQAKPRTGVKAAGVTTSALAGNPDFGQSPDMGVQ